MNEAVVLFVHHRNDAVTRLHYRLLKQFNDFPVIGLVCADRLGVTPLADAIEIPKTYQQGDNWHNVDWICHKWFNSEHQVDAKRYIWLDWDCHVNMPLSDWFGEQWNSDFVGSRIHLRYCRPWPWFRHIRRLPKSQHDFAIGVSPLNGVLLSNKAMKEFASQPLTDGVFSELRLPTVLAAGGIQIQGLPPNKAKTNVFLNNHSIDVTGRGLFHPVKVLAS